MIKCSAKRCDKPATGMWRLTLLEWDWETRSKVEVDVDQPLCAFHGLNACTEIKQFKVIKDKRGNEHAFTMRPVKRVKLLHKICWLPTNPEVDNARRVD
jgi:hypothetical protein